MMRRDASVSNSFLEYWFDNGIVIDGLPSFPFLYMYILCTVVFCSVWQTAVHNCFVIAVTYFVTPELGSMCVNDVFVETYSMASGIL